MRLTKKYFRDEVNKGFATASALLPTIVKKFGVNPKGLRNRKAIKIARPDSYWDHYISEFYFYKKKLYANVYWAGDDTDGDEAIEIIIGKTNYRIPADYYDDGYRTRCRHSDINIDREELYNAIKATLA